MTQVLLNDIEKEDIDVLANVASIIRATELLEKYFTKGKINADDYTEQCSLLIMQFKATEKFLKIPIDAFIKQYFYENGRRVGCDRAYNRLVVIGQPETVINAILSTHKIKPSDISAITESLITAEDALALGYRGMDQLLPLLTDVLTNLGKVGGLKPDFIGKVKLVQWVEKLQLLRAAAEIGDDDMRQLGLDLGLTKLAWLHFLKELN